MSHICNRLTTRSGGMHRGSNAAAPATTGHYGVDAPTATGGDRAR